MRVEKIIAALPSMAAEELERVAANARKLVETGNKPKKEAAQKVLRAIDELQEQQHRELTSRLNGLDVSARVVEAFRRSPMTKTEEKVVRVLLDNPGSTSTELSEALGWGAQSWHMHFGTMCFNRALYLWPALKSERRSADFYSGILADLSADNRWTMKPEVAAAFAEMGVRPRGE